MTMKLFPWADVVARAQKKIAQGDTLFQQWLCQHCGAKQTMPDANHFYMFGDCEECGKRTDIKSSGMNYMTLVTITPKAKNDLPDLLADIARKAEGK